MSMCTQAVFSSGVTAGLLATVQQVVALWQSSKKSLAVSCKGRVALTLTVDMVTRWSRIP